MKHTWAWLPLAFLCGCMPPMRGEQPCSGWEAVVNFRLPPRVDFCGEPVPLEREDVREALEREFYLLLQQPGQLVLYLKRSGRYFELFEQVLRRAQMPSDLKYLAIAESALLPTARSPKEAVGLWQIIPETARQLGLRVDSLVDERRHPERSTQAAIEYLRRGYERFGSWTLAAAGYNMGHDALRQQLQRQGVQSFYDAFLNEETTRYIYRILAIKHLLENAAQFGLALAPYPALRGRRIRWEHEIPDLVAWARQQGVRYRDVRVLNPWILRDQLPAPPPGAAYEILLPPE
jgi:membrane-bound lytic murein transglycosylase D